MPPVLPPGAARQIKNKSIPRAAIRPLCHALNQGLFTAIFAAPA